MTKPIHPMRAKLEGAIRRELGKREMVLASPQQLKQLQAARIARAAIQALLEPDEGMVEAGEDAMIYPDGDFIRNQAETVFQAMLKPLLGDEG